jgi:flagellar hook-length control protein FliK
MAHINLVSDARSASSVPRTGAKAQKAVNADTPAFENMLQEETLAGAAQARRAAAPQSSAPPRRSALSQAKTGDAGAEDGASPSDSAQTGQTQPAPAGLPFLAAPPVLAALDLPKVDAAASSTKSGGSTARHAGAEDGASPSDSAQSGQTQPAPAGLPFLAAPPVLAALDLPKGVAAASSTKSGDSTARHAGAEDGASPSDSAQTGQTQPAAAGLSFLAAPPVLAALDLPKVDAAASSAKSGGSTARHAGAEDGASPSDSAQTGQTQPAPAGLPFLAAPPVLAALDLPKVDAAASSAKSGGSTALDASALKGASQAAKGLAREKTGQASVAKLDAASATSKPLVEKAAGDAPQKADALPPTSSAETASQKSPTVSAAVVSARTYLAPGAPPSLKRAAEDTAAPNRVADSASPASETEASTPTQVTDFARAAKQETPQDGGSNEERSSGKDQSTASAQPPLEASSVIPVSSGSVSAPTPSQQIAQAVEAAMPQAITAGAQSDGTPAAPASLQPVKTIALALTPQNLGGVEIELSLTGGKLDVKIRAAEPETAKLLRGDDATLGKLLQSAGFPLQGLSIQVSQQAAQSSQTGAQTAPNGQGSADSSTASGGRDQGARQSAGEKPTGKGSDQGSTNGRASAYRRGGSLYL